MGTRAIIATSTARGYKTAWCWLDGFPDILGRKLRTKFNTTELANELINYHSFESLMSPNECKAFVSWREKAGVSCDDDSFIELSNGCILHMYPHHGKIVAGNGKYGFFKNIEEMLEQDINYVYVFDPERKKWKTYK